MGFKATGEDVLRKTKLALDKIMVVRSEKMAAEKEDKMTSQEPEAKKEPRSEKLRVMILDDEPIVGKRLGPALTKFGFEVEVFEDPRKALARLDEQKWTVFRFWSTSCPNARIPGS
jgi:PleD family two-component response regulator